MKFYKKHIPEWQQIQAVIHQHWLTVFQSYVLWIVFWALMPSFLYYQSEKIQDIVPFYVLEIFLFLIFIKIIYELYNWYYDVWILTDVAVYDIEWSLLKIKVESIHYENIEWVEVDRHRIWDSIFNKWDIVIHKFWEEEFAIYNAYSPFRGAEIIENYIHQKEEGGEHNNFDMIMDTLSWVVNNYLQTHGIPERWVDIPLLSQDEISEEKNQEQDAYSLDMR